MMLTLYTIHFIVNHVLGVLDQINYCLGDLPLYLFFNKGCILMNLTRIDHNSFYTLTSSNFFGLPVTKVSTGLELEVSRLLEEAATVLITALKDHVHTQRSMEERDVRMRITPIQHYVTSNQVAKKNG